MGAMGIVFTCSSHFPIGFWNCSDNMAYFCFHFIHNKGRDSLQKRGKASDAQTKYGYKVCVVIITCRTSFVARFVRYVINFSVNRKMIFIKQNKWRKNCYAKKA